LVIKHGLASPPVGEYANGGRGASPPMGECGAAGGGLTAKPKFFEKNKKK